MAQGGKSCASLPSAVMWRLVGYIALLMTVIAQEWDDYYYLKAQVQTSSLDCILLIFTDLYVRVTGSYNYSPTGTWLGLDFNLQMVINRKTITILLKGITMLLLSSYISTVFLFHFLLLSTTPPCIVWLNFPEVQQMLQFSGILRPLKSHRLRLIDLSKL